jgi:hypothetical protein
VLRRIGYILGLPFVAACVAAYPLTWGRDVQAVYGRSGWVLAADTCNGRLSVNVVRFVGWGGMDLGPSVEISQAETGARDVYAVRAARTQSGGVKEYIVEFPLWMPALAISPFMALLWRRRRRRTVGFEVEQVAAGR